MSAAVDARGLKRVCSECGIRFYDLNKRPITCPTCETEFTGEIKTKGRKGRAALIEEEEKKTAAKVASEKEVANEDEDEDEDEDDGIEEVSLDDVEAEESLNEDDDNDEDAVLGDLDEDLDEDLDDDDDLDATLPDDMDDEEDDLSDVVKGS